MQKGNELSVVEKLYSGQVNALKQKLEAISRISGSVLNEIRLIKARNFNTVSTQINFFEEIERYEIELILAALELCNGNQRQAAKVLNLKPTTINAKIKKHKIKNPFNLQK